MTENQVSQFLFSPPASSQGIQRRQRSATIGSLTMTGDPIFSSIASVLRCCIEKAGADGTASAKHCCDEHCASFHIPLLEPSPTRHRARARGLFDSGLHGLRRLKNGLLGSVSSSAECVAGNEKSRSAANDDVDAALEMEMRILRFLRLFFSMSECSSATAPVALVYLLRFQNTHGYIIESNWAILLFIALLVAQKFVDDVALSNADFPMLWQCVAPHHAPISLKRLNELEVLFLLRMDWHMAVTSNDYDLVAFELRGLLSPVHKVRRLQDKGASADNRGRKADAEGVGEDKTVGDGGCADMCVGVDASKEEAKTETETQTKAEVQIETETEVEAPVLDLSALSSCAAWLPAPPRPRQPRKQQTAPGHTQLRQGIVVPLPPLPLPESSSLGTFTPNNTPREGPAAPPVQGFAHQVAQRLDRRGAGLCLENGGGASEVDCADRAHVASQAACAASKIQDSVTVHALLPPTRRLGTRTRLCSTPPAPLRSCYSESDGYSINGCAASLPRLTLATASATAASVSSALTEKSTETDLRPLPPPPAAPFSTKPMSMARALAPLSAIELLEPRRSSPDNGLNMRIRSSAEAEKPRKKHSRALRRHKSIPDWWIHVV